MSIATTISNVFDHGGFVMWIIFSGQIISLAIIAERSFALYLRRSLNNKKIAKAFEQDIKKGKIEAVIMKAQSLGNGSAIGKTIAAGAQAALDMGGKEEIQSKMDEVLLAEHSILEKRTGFLAAIGNIGTLAGLLGTIIGLISSFNAVANSNPLEKATLLSQGISMAMNTTALGLSVAIPVMVLYSFLHTRQNKILEE